MKIHCLHSKPDIYQFDVYDSQVFSLKSDKLENKRRLNYFNTRTTDGYKIPVYV